MRILRILCGLGCAALLGPPGASAEPIALSLAGGGNAIDLGSVTLDGGSSTLIPIDGLAAHQNYSVRFAFEGVEGSNTTTLTAELLDPLSDGFDAADGPQPSYVPAGFSTSNNTD